MKSPDKPRAQEGKQGDQKLTKDGLMTAVARQVGRTAGTIVKAAQGLTGKDIPRSSGRPTVTPSVKSQVSVSTDAATKESATKKAASSPARRGRKRSSAGATAKAGANTKTKKRSS